MAHPPVPLGGFKRVALGLGIFLVVGGVYLAAGSGRIDSIDGQIRFEGTAAFLDEGSLLLRDPATKFAAALGKDGRSYNPYGPAPSLAAAPLVALARCVPDPKGELRRFLFSLTGGFFGAGTAALLFYFLLELGFAPLKSAAWSLAAAFATYLWPAAETVLDQGQHAFWALLAVWLGFLSTRRDSLVLAVAGGLAAAVLVLYQIPYALHGPILALSVLATGATNSKTTARGRYLVFASTAALGLAVLLSYRSAVFGSLVLPMLVNYPHPPTLGNPLQGISGLLLSPGKGVLFYSPALLLSLLGVRRLSRTFPSLGKTLSALTGIHLLLIGSLSFWHGEWSWGPRYLLVLIPLWCLAMPFAVQGLPRRRVLAGALIAAGVLVNVLGLAVVHERFYYERGLSTYFWYRNNAFFWQQSALGARFAEIAAMRDWDPSKAKSFAPSAYGGLLTYTIAEAGPLQPAPPAWLEDFMVFNVPRPWPFWTAAARDAGFEVPLPTGALLIGLGVAFAAGAALLVTGLRISPASQDG